MVAGVIGGAIAVIIGLVGYIFAGDDDGKASQRLDALVGGKARKDSSADILLKQALQEVDRKNIIDALTPEFLNLQKVCNQADVAVKPSMIVGVALGAGLFLAFISYLFSRVIYVVPVGFTIGFVAPFIWLFMKRNARMATFAAQLPEALELIARALRAGHSLGAGMHVVAEEMPAPISKEFGRVYEEQNLGIPLEESLKNMCERVPNLDLRFFVTSVAIQRQTGGDLAEILDKIGYVIRERYKILGMVKALTAEGRLSGIVLISLPFGLFFLMLYMKPDYIEKLWTDKLGQYMSIFALISQVIGAICIKKIVDIKV
jgi:tight adherence protein B